MSVPVYILIMYSHTILIIKLDRTIYIHIVRMDLGKIERPHFYDPRCRTLVMPNISTD